MPNPVYCRQNWVIRLPRWVRGRLPGGFLPGGRFSGEFSRGVVLPGRILPGGIQPGQEYCREEFSQPRNIAGGNRAGGSWPGNIVWSLRLTQNNIKYLFIYILARNPRFAGFLARYRVGGYFCAKKIRWENYRHVKLLFPKVSAVRISSVQFLLHTRDFRRKIGAKRKNSIFFEMFVGILMKL